MKFPKCIAMYIGNNDNASSYRTVKEDLEDSDFSVTCPDEFETLEEMNKAIDTNEIWTCIWYPDTPIGCYKVAAATFEECIAYAVRVSDKIEKE